MIVPVIVRPADNGMYEILSGHNRVNAAKVAGLTQIPVVIKTGLDDNDAKLIVTETNLVQRSFADLSHSERAVALKTHLDAIKAQGKRTDMLSEIKRLSNPHETEDIGTSSPMETKLRTNEKTGEKYDLSHASVARYIRLCELNESLLQRVDTDEIAIRAAVSLSYLSHDEQAELDKLLCESAYKVDMKKAEMLRKLSAGKRLTVEKMEQVLSGSLGKVKPKTAPPLKIRAKVYQKYFGDDTPKNEMEAVIDRALAEYFEKHK